MITIIIIITVITMITMITDRLSCYYCYYCYYTYTISEDNRTTQTHYLLRDSITLTLSGTRPGILSKRLSDNFARAEYLHNCAKFLTLWTNTTLCKRGDRTAVLGGLSAVYTGII